MRMRILGYLRFVACAALLITGGCHGGAAAGTVPQAAGLQNAAVRVAAPHHADARDRALAPAYGEVRAFRGQTWNSTAHVVTTGTAYSTTVNGRAVSVVAGTLRTNSSQGVLIVIDKQSQTAQLVAGPVGAGSLRVLRTSGREIYVVAANGRTTHVALPNAPGTSL